MSRAIKKFAMFSIVIFWSLQLVAPLAYSQMDEMNMDEMNMDEMNMYKAAKIDGCTDFHCLKCSDRTACSTGKNCNKVDCGHKHGAVLCDGGILFYIRESQGFTDAYGKPSCFARAKYVANQLNKFMGMMESHENCYFTVLDEHHNEITNNSQTPIIWFTTMVGGHFNKVISVTGGDLMGYKYRSNLPELRDKAMPANKLTRKLVAQWWAYILKDHFTMMVLNRRPYLTTYTHCGKILLTIWRQAREKIPSGKIPMNMFVKAVESLSPEEKAHLYLAAKIVPVNFNPNIR